MARIEPGTNYIIDIILFDGVTRRAGETVTLSIEKVSDGKFWDGSDFTNTTYVTVVAIEQSGDPNDVGVYRYTFASPIVNEETYRIVCDHTTADGILRTLFFEEVITDLVALSSTTETQIDDIQSRLWSTVEKANIRQALGVDGTKTVGSTAGDLQDTMGVGFSTSVHSLVALRNYLAASIIPLVAVSDTTASTLLTGTYIARTIEAVRRYTDEPSVNVKYADNDILAKLNDAWAEVWLDIIFNSEWPMIVRYNVTWAEGEDSIILPPNVGQLTQLVRLDDSGGEEIVWEVDTKSYYNPRGWGVRVTGNTLHLGSLWSGASETLQLSYIPNGEVSPIDGQWESSEDFSSDLRTVTLPVTLSNGNLDTRPNSYGGYLLRTVIPAGTVPSPGDPTTITQEHIITAYDPITRICTLATDQSPAITLGVGDTVVFEIVPMLHSLLGGIVALRASQNILAAEGNEDRMEMLALEYRRKLRSLKLQVASIAGRRATQFEGDTRDNARSGFWHPFMVRG